MAYLQPAPIRRAGLRGLANQLSRLSSPASFSTSTSASPFVCRQCLKTTKQQTSTKPSLLSSLARSRTVRQLQPPASASVRYLNTTSSKNSTSSPAASLEYVAEPAADSKEKSKTRSSSFPDTSSKSVAYWLLGSAASVFGIVVFGGLTRLTESGLSITEWRPVTGSLPPMSPEDWESEFAKYRASPEYIKLNPHMDLDEFKKIYFMEWTHRIWGRVIGMTFVLPTIYFIARRRVTKRMAWNLVGISGLIGFQGFIGWWMVASGLKDDLFAPGAHPRVSQYRLTTHLSTAFVCYSWMLLAGLSILRTRKLLADPAAASKLAKVLSGSALAPFKRYTTALTALVFVTAMSGGLVAGLDAGLIYNEFPMMGTGITPPWPELFDKFYSRKEDASDLWWRNILENPSLVQLDHRMLAMTVCASVLALFAYSRTRRVKAVLPADARKSAMGLLHLMLLQVTLGISTLIYIVPTHLAATHQAGALALLTGALVLGTRLRIPKGTMRLVERQLKTMQQKK
ncbi:cytochrome c oxidase assembly protein COX15 [Diaporthe amygdali]|uniref:cytochrome c oxidase assembly protein COX15 n=1 Tax=Phomopsis amygdali TaxID=1214568 RepID=UPI0022FE990F|nr:cytochrome c oxidase assembly protein COX15 [Diaporthe amygdali]KAJ0119791.1 cytochrome c oxidase assembly protein COX15 [Diaporthe amygdali]